MSANQYSPKVGDIVTAQGQTGIFKIVSVGGPEEGIKIQPFNVSKQETFGQVMTHIPRSVLSPFKEDASQAAVRIVREATEDK